MVVSSENKYKMIYGIIIGFLYLVFGLFQIIVSLGLKSALTDALFIPSDIMGGIILIVISAIFLFGINELNKGIDEGVAYIYVGILLAILFMIIYSLIIVANGVSAYALSNPDLENWTPLDNMKPGLYLGVLSIIGILIWRTKFVLSRTKKIIR